MEKSKLQKQIADAEAESKKKDELHQAEVERLKEDIDRRAQLHEVLKKDMEQAILEKTKADKQRDDAINALSQRAQNDQKLKQLGDENDAKTKKAESELAEFKAQSAEWLRQLILLNQEMDRKFIRFNFLPLTEFSSSGVDANICACPSAEEFTRYRKTAFDAVKAG